ncbi:hypothetical protein RHGRI_030813 [Rhododendron griersonianum]|uniref:Uncharacterized protein n=1 Tax=Rhododendron griersonianum TaxID=479676 RepID=A0AAV6I8U6_9ERIC|nr:hypothetical protein RHGRI_030813 [Rhododendron griersonianum]
MRVYSITSAHLDVDEVVDLIKTRVAFWIKAKHNVTEYSMEEFKRGIKVHEDLTEIIEFWELVLFEFWTSN